MSIPQELIKIPQWVFWRREDKGGLKPTKVPYNTAGYPCDVSDEKNYADYSLVCNGHAIGYTGVGICLTKSIKITAFDLDDPYTWNEAGELKRYEPGHGPSDSVWETFRKIIDHLDSYTEWSPSGRGFRIFIFGEIPEGWRNRVGKVEVYDSARFLTVTGNHVEGTPLTIEHRQEQLEDIMRSLKLHIPSSDGDAIQSQPETRDDRAVYDAIRNSAIGEKFQALAMGNGIGQGRDSENDLVLGNYICYFTNNKEQAERIFRATNHYRLHTKLHTRDDLVKRIISKGFDQKVPPVDISQMRINGAALSTAATPEPEPTPQVALEYPPGVLGYIMYYIMSSAPRPIPDFALAGAVGLMGGIAGRAYNVRGSGLNQYVAMLGPSTVGKEAVSSGITKLLFQASEFAESAQQFFGPGMLSSAPALYKALNKAEGGTPSFVSILGEFGDWLLEHCSQKANDTKRGVFTALLKLYGQSGKNSQTGSIIYSDRDKNAASVKSPSLSLIGEGVPDTFFEACTAKNIQNGFIPRFLIFNYLGLKPPLNASHHLFRGEKQHIEWFAGFCTYCHQLNTNDTPIEVTLDADATKIFDEYLTFTDAKNNENLHNPAGAVWGRTYMKALKLAALRAVGQETYKPVINAADAHWAIQLANRDVGVLVDKLNDGEIQNAQTVSGDDPRHRVIAHVYTTFISKPFASLNKQFQAETTAEAHDRLKIMRRNRLKNMCVARAPWLGMNPALRDRDFTQALAEMDDVLRMHKAGDLAKSGDAVDYGKLRELGCKEPSTEIVRPVDTDAITRLISKD